MSQRLAILTVTVTVTVFPPATLSLDEQDIQDSEQEVADGIGLAQ